MPVQKVKTSRAKRDSRRSQHDKIRTLANASACPRCHEPKLPHRVCATCGYYRDREIFAPRDDAEQK